MKGNLMCGTAKVEITPDESMLGAIYGLMGVPYVSVIDPLFLRVIALDNGSQKALLVAFDLDKAPKPVEFIKLLMEKTGIPEANIIFIGTHTHSAPTTTIRAKEKPRNPLPESWTANMRAYEDMLENKLAQAVDAAMADMQPVSIGYGKGKSYINVNRNLDFQYEDENGTIWPVASQGPNCAEEIDREVFVIQIKDANGKPVAFFVNYPVHCCTMFLNNADGKGNMGISPDIAGAVSCMLEDKYEGAVAIWSSGAAGNINPILGNEVFFPNPQNGKADRYLVPDADTIDHLMKTLAARHFADVLSTIRTIDNDNTEAEIAGALEWSETPCYEMKEVAPRVHEIVGDSDEPYRIRMQLLRIGEIGLCGIGGELYDSFGRMLKANAKVPGFCVINHNASLIDDAGYILDDDTLARVRRKSPIRGAVPGNQISAKAGYVGPSLKAHEDSLFAKVL